MSFVQLTVCLINTGKKNGGRNRLVILFTDLQKVLSVKNRKKQECMFTEGTKRGKNPPKKVK